MSVLVRDILILSVSVLYFYFSIVVKSHSEEMEGGTPGQDMDEIPEKGQMA